MIKVIHQIKTFFSEHFPFSYFEEVTIADGVGEWATTTVAVGKNNNLEIKKEIHFPPLGLLYSAYLLHRI